MRFDLDYDEANGFTWDTDWSTERQVQHSYNTIGEHKAALEVRDSGGLTDTAFYTVNVLDPANNEPPTEPTCDFPENNSLVEPTLVTLDWSCSDPDADQLKFDIYFGTSQDPPLYAENITNGYLKHPTTEPNSTFYWRVSAYDGFNPRVYSQVFKFSTNSEGNINVPCPEQPVVEHGGRTYETVKIGNQCWFKENLDIGTMITTEESPSDNGIIEKYCYDNDPANCDEYGGLYSWHEMMNYEPGSKGICPDGWHIAADYEWEYMCRYLCGRNGGVLKEEGIDHWLSPNDYGTNLTGFSAFGGGFYTCLGNGFSYFKEQGFYWTSTDSGENAVFRLLMYNNGGLSRGGFKKEMGYSVRCVKD
jgi:uncharacterized protein (TIGR02145 family)